MPPRLMQANSGDGTAQSWEDGESQPGRRRVPCSTSHQRRSRMQSSGLLQDRRSSEHDMAEGRLSRDESKGGKDGTGVRTLSSFGSLGPRSRHVGRGAVITALGDRELGGAAPHPSPSVPQGRRPRPAFPPSDKSFSPIGAIPCWKATAHFPTSFRSCLSLIETLQRARTTMSRHPEGLLTGTWRSTASSPPLLLVYSGLSEGHAVPCKALLRTIDNSGRRLFPLVSPAKESHPAMAVSRSPGLKETSPSLLRVTLSHFAGTVSVRACCASLIHSDNPFHSQK